MKVAVVVVVVRVVLLCKRRFFLVECPWFPRASGTKKSQIYLWLFKLNLGGTMDRMRIFAQRHLDGNLVWLSAELAQRCGDVMIINTQADRH